MSDKSPEFRSVKLSDTPGKNLKLVCLDGEVDAHFNILYTESEYVYMLARRGQPIERLEIPFKCSTVDMCVRTFYGEIKQYFLPETYPVFLFFTAKPRYLDIDNYCDFGSQDVPEFIHAREIRDVKMIIGKSENLCGRPKLSKEEFEEKFSNLVNKELNEDEFSNSSSKRLHNHIFELRERLVGRLSTILEDCVDSEQYDSQIKLTLDFVDACIPECLNGIKISGILDDLEIYGIGDTNSESYYDGIGTRMHHQTKKVEMARYSVNIYTRVLAKIPKDVCKILSLEQYTYVMPKISDNGFTIEEINIFSVRYDWISIKETKIYTKNGRVITEEEYLQVVKQSENTVLYQDTDSYIDSYINPWTAAMNNYAARDYLDMFGDY